MKLNLLALYFAPFRLCSYRRPFFSRSLCFLAVLLGYSLTGLAQAEKYANIDVFPDSAILRYLQNAYPADKLNYYDVKLNGRMQHVKNYYDYISFRCVLTDSVPVKAAPAFADTIRMVTPDSTGILRDSAGLRVDSARLDSSKTPVAVSSAASDTLPALHANTSNQLAAVLSASNDISLSDNNVLAKRQVDSSWVLGDTLISARRGVTHPTETAVPVAGITEPSPVPASFVVASDTVFMINCGANTEHRPNLIWIYHSRDPSTHIVVGAGDFKEEMIMLQSFCESLGPKLNPFLVEIWDLFVKSHQSAMYTPVYDHEAHYQSAPPAADAPLPVTQ